MSQGTASHLGTNQLGPHRGAEAMATFFSRRPGRVPWERESVGWLDNGSRGCGWPPWGNDKNTGAQMQSNWWEGKTREDQRKSQGQKDIKAIATLF